MAAPVLLNKDGEFEAIDGEMVELALLLPSWQATALEATASSRGLTPGQMVRSVLHDFFGKFAQPGPLEDC